MTRTEVPKSLEVENLAVLISMIAKLDLYKACSLVLTSAKNLESDAEREQAVTLLAGIFGGNHFERKLAFEENPSSEQARILKELVIFAYKAVRLADDKLPDENDTPSRRERAEDARSFLYNSLIKTKSKWTPFILSELSSLEVFSCMTDRLKQLATESAAELSEPNPMSFSSFNQLDDYKFYQAFDKRSLFSIMNNRLGDFEHHLLNDEFSIVDTLRKVESETELRRFISYWLQLNKRKSYTINQETVSYAEKRTDIRLQSSHTVGDFYVAIELKLAGKNIPKWTGSQLRDALTDQLVGNYLKHERCRGGCLLICMREKRKWENPETKKRMDLRTTVNWLQGIADELTGKSPGLSVSVMGIDYSE